ncbi:hypothetical protein HZS_261, partial [Henneguya salminicola]
MSGLMATLNRKYRFFDKNLSHQEFYNSSSHFLLASDAMLVLVCRKQESVFDNSFYYELIDYFLKYYPSPFLKSKFPDEIEKNLTKINSRILMTISNIFNDIDTGSKIIQNIYFKRFFGFHIIYSIIRLYGHAQEYQTLVVPLIHTMVSVNIQLHDKETQTTTHIFLEFLSHFQNQIKTLKTIPQDLMFEIIDFLFVCQTLIIELKINDPFTSEFIIHFGLFIELFLNSTEYVPDQLSVFIDHIKICALKIIEFWFNIANIQNSETIAAFMSILYLNKFVALFSEYENFKKDIYNRIKCYLHPEQFEFAQDKLYFIHYSPNVKFVCAIFPDIDPEIIKSLLEIYPNPDILVSKLLDDPNTVYQAKQINEVPKPKIVCNNVYILPESDLDIKNINMRLIEKQDEEYTKEGIDRMHYISTVFKTKRNLMKNIPVPIFSPNDDDDFDESDEDLIALKITSYKFADILLSQNFDISKPNNSLYNSEFHRVDSNPPILSPDVKSSEKPSQ